MKIRLNGTIVSDEDYWIYELFGIAAVSPNKIISQIERAERAGGKDLTVVINSGGGSVFAASEIYTALKSYPGNVVVEIAGIAASAASVIAMAGDKITISPTAQIMIHNALMQNTGDYRSMDVAGEFLQNVNKSIMNAYIKQTNKSEEELKAMMDEEVWMTAQQAKEQGFVDEIMFESAVDVVANASGSGMLPREVINAMKNKLVSGEISIKGSVANKNEKSEKEDNQNNSEEEGIMDLEKLKNEHPELYKEIKNNGYEAGVLAENKRIKEIDNLAQVGMEDLIKNAKFEEPMNAGELAIAILNKQKEIGQSHIRNIEEDAKDLEQIEDKSPDNRKEEEEAQKLANSSKTLEALFEGSAL